MRSLLCLVAACAACASAQTPEPTEEARLVAQLQEMEKQLPAGVTEAAATIWRLSQVASQTKDF